MHPNLPDARKVAFKYDYLGRRVEKTVYNWVDDEWQQAAVRRLLWSGWLLLMELDGNNNVVRKYTWGLDLAGQMGQSPSGSERALEGAGGILDNASHRQGRVGGLLAVSDPNDPNDTCGDFVYFYDGSEDTKIGGCPSFPLFQVDPREVRADVSGRSLRSGHHPRKRGSFVRVRIGSVRSRPLCGCPSGAVASLERGQRAKMRPLRLHHARATVVELPRVRERP